MPLPTRPAGGFVERVVGKLLGRCDATQETWDAATD